MTVNLVLFCDIFSDSWDMKTLWGEKVFSLEKAERTNLALESNEKCQVN